MNKTKVQLIKELEEANNKIRYLNEHITRQGTKLQEADQALKATNEACTKRYSELGAAKQQLLYWKQAAIDNLTLANKYFTSLAKQ